MQSDRRGKGLVVRWTWLSSSTVQLSSWAISGTSFPSEAPFPQLAEETEERGKPSLTSHGVPSGCRRVTCPTTPHTVGTGNTALFFQDAFGVIISAPSQP